MKRWSRHDELVETIEWLGYTVSSLYLNSADFGSAQARKRMFLVCDKQGAVITRERLLSFSESPSRTATDIINWNANFKSDKLRRDGRAEATLARADRAIASLEIGRASCRESGHSSTVCV